MRLYAHRGSPGTTAHENTVPAVTGCLAAGADGVEVDLRLSADGVLVLSHDADLRRVAGLDLTVATTSWDVLRSAASARGVPLARVEWLLAAAAGRPVVLELKQPLPGRTPATALAVLEVLGRLAAAGLPLDVTVSSFSPHLVGVVRELAPERLGLRTALLGRPDDVADAVLRRALEAGHDEVHPHVGALLASPATVARAHAVGTDVVPWTVNAGRDLRRLAGLGVRAVITDVPVTARAVLARRRSAA